MSKALPPHSQCGKIRYVLRKYAAEWRKKLSRKFGHDFTIYKCPECGGYHLSTKENGVKFRERKKRTQNQTGNPARYQRKNRSGDD